MTKCTLLCVVVFKCCYLKSALNRYPIMISWYITWFNMTLSLNLEDVLGGGGLLRASHTVTLIQKESCNTLYTSLNWIWIQFILSIEKNIMKWTHFRSPSQQPLKTKNQIQLAPMFPQGCVYCWDQMVLLGYCSILKHECTLCKCQFVQVTLQIVTSDLKKTCQSFSEGFWMFSLVDTSTVTRLQQSCV